MGSFSWLKAETSCKTQNVIYGKPFKFLIPEEYGGGYIKDYYRDYGNLSGVIRDGVNQDNKSQNYDMYEVLAFWNADKSYKDGIVRDYLKWNGDFSYMKTVDEFTDENRSIGIDIGCYDDQILELKYPLKLTSPRWNKTYEETPYPSFGDPNQGWFSYSREKFLEEYADTPNF